MVYVLPKIVWTHWDSLENIPELCVLTIKRNHQILKGWEIKFFTTDDFLQWCTPPTSFHTLSIQAKTDYMRLWLLKHYGGVWMDCSIVLNVSLDKLYNECLNNKSELSGFYLEGFTTNIQYPVFESWFIMAPKESRIVELWYEEFVSAMNLGFAEYKKKVLKEGVDLQNIMFDTYLTIHICYQVVIQKRVSFAPNVQYKKAEDTMLSVHDKCKWDGECMKDAFKSPNILNIPYIKLRGGDRELFPLDYFRDIL